ncbi:MAG: MOSC N-terminal beta barrel domain-containing protein [Gaiellaceae bacterium]
MPTVTRISIAPVKGLALVHPDEVDLEKTGVLANRRFYIVDENGRRYGQIRNGKLVEVKPAYDPEQEHLTLSFPDGTTAEGDVRLGDEVTTDFYGRPVTGRIVLGPWAQALSSWFGRPLHLVQSAPGQAVDRDRGHVSLISEGSLRELARQAGQDEPVDGRRFRMLFQVDGLDAHGEDAWLKRRVRIGDALVLLRGTVGRCAITMQNPETGVPDFNTLRVLKDYRGLSADRQLDFGVYGEVLEAGRARVGDSVQPRELSLLDATA